MFLRPASVPGRFNLRCGAKFARENRSGEEVELSLIASQGFPNRQNLELFEH